jgi:hypothetical protein
MVFQEHEEREAEASLGKAAGAAMTRGAAIGKQTRARLALIEILRVCRGASEKPKRAENQQPAQRLGPENEMGLLHAASFA